MWTLRNALFFVCFCSAVISSVTSDCERDIRTCTARNQHERKLHATIECTIAKQYIDCMEPVLDKCSGALLGTTEESLRKGVNQLKRLCTVGDPLYEKKEKFKDCLKASQDEFKACELADELTDSSTEHKLDRKSKLLKSICRKSKYIFNCIYDVTNRVCGSEGRDFVKETTENGIDVFRKKCAAVEIDISEAVISYATSDCEQDIKTCREMNQHGGNLHAIIECTTAKNYIDCLEPVLIKCGAFLGSRSLWKTVNQLKKLCTVGDPLYQKKEKFKYCLKASEDQFKACGSTDFSAEHKPEESCKFLESMCRKEQNVTHCIYDVANRACGSEVRDFVKESTENSQDFVIQVCAMVKIDLT